MESQKGTYRCSLCQKVFNVKSNLTRHMKTHDERTFKCQHCSKIFTLKHQLDRHLQLHFHPSIPQHKTREARLEATKEALRVASQPSTVDKVWKNPETAEKAARKLTNGPLWRASLVIPFGKYAGQNYKWLLENAVGWVVWIVATYKVDGEKNPTMRWQKEVLSDFVSDFPSVMLHVEGRVKVSFSMHLVAEAVSVKSLPMILHL